MSGVFLTVWDKQLRDKTQLLRMTEGGWPHITLVHSGKHLSMESLLHIKERADNALIGQWVTLWSASIDTFTKEDGVKWHYVLLGIKEEELIDEVRKEHVLGNLPDGFDNSTLNMRTPHITHSTHTSWSDAKNTLDTCLAIINEAGNGHKVMITGSTLL